MLKGIVVVFMVITFAVMVVFGAIVGSGIEGVPEELLLYQIACLVAAVAVVMTASVVATFGYQDIIAFAAGFAAAILAAAALTLAAKADYALAAKLSLTAIPPWVVAMLKWDARCY